MANFEPEWSLAFLCHSWTDKAAVRELYHQLTNDGYRCWFDEVDLLPGQVWEREINRALRRCDYVIVCLSQASVSRRGFAQKEIKTALDIADELTDGEIFLIPLCLEPCEPPERLRHLHWVNLFSETGYQQLTRALQPRGVSNATVPASAWDRIVPPAGLERHRSSIPWQQYRATTTSVLISYRRNDVPATAGSLYDNFIKELGSANVFIDVDSVDLGLDLREVVSRAVAQSNAVVVLMGTKWLGHDRYGSRKIDSPYDIVRIEVETALELRKPVIPVLVDGADMPPAESLPDSIARLASFSALHLSTNDNSFDSAAARTLQLLRRLR